MTSSWYHIVSNPKLHLLPQYTMPTKTVKLWLNSCSMNVRTADHGWLPLSLELPPTARPPAGGFFIRGHPQPCSPGFLRPRPSAYSPKIINRKPKWVPAEASWREPNKPMQCTLRLHKSSRHNRHELPLWHKALPHVEYKNRQEHPWWQIFHTVNESHQACYDL